MKQLHHHQNLMDQRLFSTLLEMLSFIYPILMNLRNLVSRLSSFIFSRFTQKNSIIFFFKPFPGILEQAHHWTNLNSIQNLNLIVLLSFSRVFRVLPQNLIDWKLFFFQPFVWVLLFTLRPIQMNLKILAQEPSFRNFFFSSLIKNHHCLNLIIFFLEKSFSQTLVLGNHWMNQMNLITFSISFQIYYHYFLISFSVEWVNHQKKNFLIQNPNLKINFNQPSASTALTILSYKVRQSN